MGSTALDAAQASSPPRTAWSNNITGAITEADLDGTTGGAVNAGHVFWTDSASNAIGEANLDGTTANDKFITGANEAEGAPVDGLLIHWTVLATNTIGRANLDGTHVDENFIVLGSGVTLTTVTRDELAGTAWWRYA